jgi:hypothetical protein
MATAMPETWLGNIIKGSRKIKRWIKWLELRAETDDIMKKMKAHPKSAAVIAATDEEALVNLVQAALAVADHVEDEVKKDPSLMTGQPEEQAALYIARRLNIVLN